MSKLYIANCTAQNHDFLYRVPGQAGVRKQAIGSASQIVVSGDLTTGEIDSIVEQHRSYGLVCVDEIDRTKPFIGMCYAVGKPVAIEKLRRAIEHNHLVMAERGKELRKEAAVAANNALEGIDSPLNLTALEMSVVEEESADREPTIAEGIRVTRQEPGDMPPRPQRQNSRGRRAA